MRSNWRYEVLDTMSVDLKENPQTVIDRMRRLEPLEEKEAVVDYAGLMTKCRKNGRFCMQPFCYGRRGHKYVYGPISLCGTIQANEQGGTRLSAVMVRDKWYRVIGAVGAVVTSALLFLMIYFENWLGMSPDTKPEEVFIVNLVIAGMAIGLAVFGIAGLFEKKRDYYHVQKQLKTEFDECVNAIKRWEE